MSPPHRDWQGPQDRTLAWTGQDPGLDRAEGLGRFLLEVRSFHGWGWLRAGLGAQVRAGWMGRTTTPPPAGPAHSPWLPAPKPQTWSSLKLCKAGVTTGGDFSVWPFTACSRVSTSHREQGDPILVARRDKVAKSPLIQTPLPGPRPAPPRPFRFPPLGPAPPWACARSTFLLGTGRRAGLGGALGMGGALTSPAHQRTGHPGRRWGGRGAC